MMCIVADEIFLRFQRTVWIMCRQARLQDKGRRGVHSDAKRGEAMRITYAQHDLRHSNAWPRKCSWAAPEIYLNRLQQPPQSARWSPIQVLPAPISPTRTMDFSTGTVFAESFFNLLCADITSGPERDNGIRRWNDKTGSRPALAERECRKRR